ncbi:MAG: Sec7-like guanine-nucleotide exchange factor [Planctomycetota bacterium]|jgi:hypothetical protein
MQSDTDKTTVHINFDDFADRQQCLAHVYAGVSTAQLHSSRTRFDGRQDITDYCEPASNRSTNVVSVIPSARQTSRSSTRSSRRSPDSILLIND